ncbi:isochorismatase [Aspergillus sp. HF37]|nr:isochorismatase [Aspergillus sp. HF37]
MAAPTISRACRIRNPALFICDIQEKFRPAIFEFNKLSSSLVNTTTKLLKAAGPLNIPIYVTTQSRAKLGDTVAELHPYTSPSTNSANVRANIDKTFFSMITPEIDAQLPSPRGENGPLDAIIVGIESHICVTQTTLDLLERGHRVYVIVDGVSSINPEERGVALARLRDAGAVVTSSESVMFEVMGDAKNEGFKEVSGVVKEMKEETKEAMGILARI